MTNTRPKLLPIAEAGMPPLVPATRLVKPFKPVVGDALAAAHPALARLGETVGLAVDRARAALVSRLREAGVREEMVLRAISLVPRHHFVDEALASRAYDDTALPIGHEQTTSKPLVIARMIECLLRVGHEGAQSVRPLGRVLEIGTGCGYQAAVLSLVAREVYSVERVKSLHDKARLNLRPLRIPNVRLHFGDGQLGLPQAAPFDAIIVSAAGASVPSTLLQQMAVGGCLIAPISSEKGRVQHLHFVQRTSADHFHTTLLETVFFVPLKSGTV